MSLHSFGVADLAIRIRNQDCSPVEVVESYLSRIEALEPTLHAWALVDGDRARAAAKQCEQDLQKGTATGALCGVPIGLKDIIYTKGVRTAAGSRVYEDFVPTYDATCVARLKAAGAIILGKTVTTEFATADPSPTANPWNTAHTPGGSSSGSGASVAARMVPAALGSQTGGSTLRPAAYNGVVGLKPTYGRISRYGVIPVSWCLDHVGILARSVEDAALMLQACAGYDTQDPGSLNEAVGNYVNASQQGDTAPRIGVLRDYFAETAQAEVWQHTEMIISQFEQSGATVREMTLPPSFGVAHPGQRLVMKVEMAAFHHDLFMEKREQYGAKIRQWIEAGLVVPGVDYLKAMRIRRQFQTEVDSLFKDVDVLLTPATPAPAPADRNTTGDASFQVPWTYAGVPAMALPSGLSQNGMPLGIQLISPACHEEQLISAARWCEDVLNFTSEPSF